MNIFKFYILVGLFSSGFVLAGNDSGGIVLRDYLDAIQSREKNPEEIYVTEGFLDSVVFQNGFQIKERVVIPTFKYFLANSISKNLATNDDSLDRMRAFLDSIKVAFESNRKELFIDISESDIGFGDCPDQKDLCTANEPYKKIILDKEQLLSHSGINNRLKIDRFFAMLLHEYTHHFFGDIDHSDYYFTNYMEYLIMERKYITRVFSGIDLVDSYQGANYIWVIIPDISIQNNADLVCDFYGFKKADDWDTIELNFSNFRVLDLIKLGIKTWTDGTFKYRGKFFVKNKFTNARFNIGYTDKFTSRKIFTSLTCIN